MRVITLAGSPRFPSRSSALLEYARERLNASGCGSVPLESAQL